MKRDLTLQIRLSESEKQLIDDLTKKGGFVSSAETIRQSLRGLAKELNVKVKPAKD